MVFTRTMLFEMRESQCLSLSSMVGRADLQHIQMTEVPEAYFTTFKSRDILDIEFHKNLLQVTVGSHGTIYNLDAAKIAEVDKIENID